jgi:hypothetical protein
MLSFPQQTRSYNKKSIHLGNSTKSVATFRFYLSIPNRYRNRAAFRLRVIGRRWNGFPFSSDPRKNNIRVLVTILAFHHGAKSSDIGQSAEKCPACTNSTFPYRDKIFVLYPWAYALIIRETCVPLNGHRFQQSSCACWSPTGEATGLTEPLVLNHETALLLKNDSDAFAQFCMIMHIWSRSFLS